MKPSPTDAPIRHLPAEPAQVRPCHRSRRLRAGRQTGAHRRECWSRGRARHPRDATGINLAEDCLRRVFGPGFYVRVPSPGWRWTSRRASGRARIQYSGIGCCNRAGVDAPSAPGQRNSPHPSRLPRLKRGSCAPDVDRPYATPFAGVDPRSTPDARLGSAGRHPERRHRASGPESTTSRHQGRFGCARLNRRRRAEADAPAAIVPRRRDVEPVVPKQDWAARRSPQLIRCSDTRARASPACGAQLPGPSREPRACRPLALPRRISPRGCTTAARGRRHPSGTQVLAESP